MVVNLVHVVDVATARLADVQRTVGALNEAFTQTVPRFHDIPAHFVKIDTDVDTLKTKLTQRTSEAVSIIAELRDDIRVLQETASKVELLRSEVAQLSSEVAPSRSEVAQLRSEVELLRSELAPLRSEVASLRQEVASAFQSKELPPMAIAELQQESFALSEAYKKQRLEAFTIVTDLRRDIESLKASILARNCPERSILSTAVNCTCVRRRQSSRDYDNNEAHSVPNARSVHDVPVCQPDEFPVIHRHVGTRLGFASIEVGREVKHTISAFVREAWLSEASWSTLLRKTPKLEWALMQDGWIDFLADLKGAFLFTVVGGQLCCEKNEEIHRNFGGSST